MTVKKKESTLANMVLVLLIITLVAGVSLGYVNELTRAPIAAAQLAKKVNALESVLPDFDNDPLEQAILVGLGADSLEVYPAFTATNFAGAAVTGTSEKGYNGLVRVLVGFDPEGKIINIAVLEQKETPGLGTKMQGDRFLRQFREKDPANFELKSKKDGGDVDALAGATISTRAFTEATRQANDGYLKYRENQQETDK